MEREKQVGLFRNRGNSLIGFMGLELGFQFDLLSSIRNSL